MTLRVRFSAHATAEFLDATSWYEQQRPGLGDVFIEAVDAAVDVVAEWPGSGSLVDDVAVELGVRRAPIGGFPYHLAYRVLADHMRVLAVAHDRRKPGYWTSRA